ncbi:MAG: nuclear transport factor 2 family protein [Methyloceanibacter sp.]
MPKMTAILSLALLLALGAPAARADDAQAIDAINKAAASLDTAFEKDDAGTVKQLMTADHIAVTPYYDGPQTVAEQIASLPDFAYEQTIAGDVSVAMLGPDAALRSFAAELNGTFKGRPMPARVFVSSIWVKQDGAWAEKFYQVTALRPGHGERRACRALAGTYLSKNVAKGGDGGVISRSIISLDPSGIALFTDSGEGGEAGFAPFTDGRGTWQCVAGADGTPRAHATTLDFTEPTEAHPKPGIGRLDFDFAAGSGDDDLSGTATLHLVPLDADPLDESTLKDGRSFAIGAERVEP